ncbi:hypothetical protein CROQUDRAFT_44570 [Cronartium quercuum f. sp. fusiforme G11]|uniref:Oligopeptide transporter n=1 Tax=Cronartium quercuum f. sp. fusiforme G11 TaxID=708437 RepID=A0A9P6NMQ7_9BASI|nr:hypothetical protein CROQUDRAFT_44570 [Cronartium quercuum f. sp. fusiforme G11]
MEEKNQAEVRFPSITIRSVLVGVLVSAFGAASAQIFMFKPVMLHVHSLFVQLACLTIGNLAARVPGPRIWNPGQFSIREATFSSVMAAAGSASALSIEMIGVRVLLFHEKPKVLYSLIVMLSSQMIGYGWAGLLCPLFVFPANVAFPSVLPSVTLFRSMYAAGDLKKKQISFFKKALIGISIYEIFPTYVAPCLQAISPWCLVLPKVPSIGNLFGGSRVGQGLGFLELSLDWSILGAGGPLFTPLAAQVSTLLSSLSMRLPFISFSLLDQKGQVYNTSAVLNPDGTENRQAVEELGTPFFSTTYILGKAFVCFAASAAFTTAVLQKRSTIMDVIKRKRTIIDPDREICRKLKDFPMWGFGAIACISISLAFIALRIENSGLSNVGLLCALLISFVLSLASGFFYGTTGVRLHTSPIVQMLGGLFFPGNAAGTMCFTMYGASTGKKILTKVLPKTNKLMQKTNSITFDVVIGQIIGTFVGVLINFLVMLSILSCERDALLSPAGNGVFSGLHLASFQAQSITWGIFGKRLYTHGGLYSFVPYFLAAGFVVPFLLFFLHRIFPKLSLDKINIALFAGTFYECVTSGFTLRMVFGFISQFYWKRYYKDWYKNYNYILSAALDGGTQIAVVLLTFLLQGGAGFTAKFPNYFLNPASGPRDYCYAGSKDTKNE